MESSYTSLGCGIAIVPFDSHRVVLTGGSSAAAMNHHLARELPDRIAAIAPIAGSCAGVPRAKKNRAGCFPTCRAGVWGMFPPASRRGLSYSMYKNRAGSPSEKLIPMLPGEPLGELRNRACCRTESA